MARVTRAARVVRERPVKRVRPVTRVKSAVPAGPAKSAFGTGVIEAAEADEAHGSSTWGAIVPKAGAIITAVGYALYQLFTSN